MKKNDSVYVSCDGVAGSEEDVIAVLGIVSNIAKELGVDEEPCGKAKEVCGDE